ncbi:MAG: tRNA (N(6)-L-threonylcarbamoyladenosine(37)-C(2))-methylthiotransferase MtaB [bacterium]
MKKVAINTLGCKTNQLESSMIVENFVEYGFEVVKFSEHADIYIINSCSVTAKSDNDSKYFVRQAKRKNPQATIVITGCYAQVSAEEASKIEDVDFVIGNTEKQNIAEIVLNKKDKVSVSNIMDETEFKGKKVYSASGRTRAVMKIQDGCNNRCSYCIIPYARGKSRSNNLDNIIEQVKELTDKGFTEIMLSGIHIGLWGADLEPKVSMLDLCKELEKIENLKRYRLGSLYPTEITDEMIEIFVNSEKFCRHLHISLQSADNSVLKAMGRNYPIETYINLVKKLVKLMPDIAVGSDIIVGFPGETHEMFENTCKNLQNLPISYLHVFPYSKRKGTPAAEMPNQINENEKKLRAETLKKIALEKNSIFKHNQLNKIFNVIVEKNRDKSTNKLKGITDNYLTVLFEGDDSLQGSLVSIQTSDIIDNQLHGKLL